MDGYRDSRLYRAVLLLVPVAGVLTASKELFGEPLDQSWWTFLPTLALAGFIIGAGWANVRVWVKEDW
jgi:hypothetical protein